MELYFENCIGGERWMRNRMNGMTREFQPAPRRLSPPVDVVEDAEGYRFYFEMPGLKSESIDVRVEEGKLIVEAERRRPELPNGAALRFAERAWGQLRRAFELPKDASAERVRANYRDGVLEVTIEKRPEAKPVKIQIN
ncbi:Hsp20/alpha crystallin family protein [bacterium]|jgi:HSP20 family protein|nr:Hsp20/alpha crystallin family protein [bacterium]